MYLFRAKNGWSLNRSSIAAKYIINSPLATKIILYFADYIIQKIKRGMYIQELCYFIYEDEAWSDIA